MNIEQDIVALEATDIVPRKPADPAALEALHGMIGRTVTVRHWEVDENGMREIETEAELFSSDGWKSPPDAA